MQKINNKQKNIDVRHPREDGGPDSNFNLKKVKTIFGIILSFFGIVYFIYIIFTNSPFLFKQFDPIQAEKIYSESQWQKSQNISEIKVLDEWALNNGYTGWRNYEDEIVIKSKVESRKSEILKNVRDKGISDSFLYSYVGYKYITGTNPSLLNPEHPPLAKYLIGTSIWLFGSEHVLGIGIALLCLLLVGLLSYSFYSSYIWAGASLFLTAVFPLFKDQLIHGPQLELYQLFFFLVCVYLLRLYEKDRRLPILMSSGVAFGFMLSTKTLVPHLFLFGVWLVIVFWKRKQELLLLLVAGGVAFCATYFQYFLLGGTLKTFLGLQKYIVVFYGNSHIPLTEFVGNYLRLIATGQWKFWDLARTVSTYSEWNVLWPIIFTVGMYKLKIHWNQHKSTHALIWFVILYNLFVFIVPIFPRYLLLLYIPLIILL